MKRAAHLAERVRRCIVIIAVMLPAVVSSSLAFGATDRPPAPLSAYHCYDCHGDRESVTGPAFADIAASYRGTQDAEVKIASDIRSGIRRGGPWHMPPHPEVSTSEARAMARYILSLDRKDAAQHEAGRR
jgi:cytochrome c551/c552